MRRSRACEVLQNVATFQHRDDPAAAKYARARHGGRGERRNRHGDALGST